MPSHLGVRIAAIPLSSAISQFSGNPGAPPPGGSPSNGGNGGGGGLGLVGVAIGLLMALFGLGGFLTQPSPTPSSANYPTSAPDAGGRLDGLRIQP